MNLRLPHFIRHNLLRKIVALFFAVLVWLAVNNQIHRGSQEFTDLPVTVIKDIESSLRVDTDRINVSVKVRGRKSELEEVSREDVQPFVDISNVKQPGSYKRRVKVRLETEANVTVTETTPSSVSIKLVEARPDTPDATPGKREKK